MDALKDASNTLVTIGKRIALSAPNKYVTLTTEANRILVGRTSSV